MMFFLSKKALLYKPTISTGDVRFSTLRILLFLAGKSKSHQEEKYVQYLHIRASRKKTQKSRIGKGGIVLELEISLEATVCRLAIEKHTKCGFGDNRLLYYGGWGF